MMKLSERIRIRAEGNTNFEPYYDVLGQWADEVAQLEAELLKFRRLDVAWAEEVKKQDLTIANLEEELEHLHSRFDRVLNNALKEGG